MSYLSESLKKIKSAQQAKSVPARFTPTGDTKYDLQRAFTQLYGVMDDVRALQSSSIVTREEADANYSPEMTRRQLQVNGQYPLNVQGLMGVLAQPQISGAPSVPALPGLDDPRSQDGALVALNGVLYRFDGSTSPGVWTSLATSILFGTYAGRDTGFPPANYSPGTFYYATDWQTLFIVLRDGGGINRWYYATGCYSGTLANLPSSLTPYEAGVLYFATDYGHLYRWDGSDWGWGPGESGSGWGVMAESQPQGPSGYWDEVPITGGSVTAARDDGSTTSISFGAYTPIGSGYSLYVRR